MGIRDRAEQGVIEVAADDLEDLEVLYAELRGTPGVVVEAPLAPMVPGDQGAVLELLTVACSGGAITVFLQIIKELVESRGPRFVLKIRHGKDRLEVSAANVEDVLPIIKSLLDGS